MLAVADAGARERVASVSSSVDASIPATATRVVVLYRVSAREGVDGVPANGPRFDVQVNQALPFLRFTNSQWAMLIAVRNVFRDALSDASVFDELFVVRPPTRIVGGLTVSF